MSTRDRTTLCRRVDILLLYLLSTPIPQLPPSLQPIYHPHPYQNPIPPTPSTITSCHNLSPPTPNFIKPMSQVPHSHPQQGTNNLLREDAFSQLLVTAVAVAQTDETLTFPSVWNCQPRSVDSCLNQTTQISVAVLVAVLTPRVCNRMS